MKDATVITIQISSSFLPLNVYSPHIRRLSPPWCERLIFPGDLKPPVQEQMTYPKVLHLSTGNSPFITRKNPNLPPPVRRTELPFSSPASYASPDNQVVTSLTTEVFEDNAIASSSALLEDGGMEGVAEGIEDVSASQWEEVTGRTPRAGDIKAARGMSMVIEERMHLEMDDGQNVVRALEKEAERITEVDEQRRRRARKDNPRRSQLGECRKLPVDRNARITLMLSS